MRNAKSAGARIQEDTGHPVLLGFTENEQGHSVYFRPCGTPSLYGGAAVHRFTPGFTPNLKVNTLISESADWPRIVNGHT